MRPVLIAEVIRRHGVITRSEALAVVPHHVLDRAVGSGRLVRRHPKVFILVELTEDATALDLAAVRYAGGALSHVTALRRYGLLPPGTAEAVRHVTRGPSRHLRGDPSVVVHRRQTVVVVTRDGLPIVPLEQALVESWPLLPPEQQRALMIAVVNEGRTTPERLMATVLAQPRTEGAASMEALCSLLRAGCRSELELWGHRRAFDRPELAGAVLQYRVQTAVGTVVLDRAHLREKVGVELDGAAWHGSRAQRERDVRRDAALAAAGWVIVRFTHARLHHDPEGCANELIAILAARRQQLRAQ